MAGGGTSPGGQPGAPKPSGIDAAAANGGGGGGGLTWAGGKLGVACGHSGLVKNPRVKGDVRELETAIDVGGNHGKLTLASGRLPPRTASAPPDSSLIVAPVAVASLWTGVRDCVPRRQSSLEFMVDFRDVTNLSETLILRSFCRAVMDASMSSLLRSPSDLCR